MENREQSQRLVVASPLTDSEVAALPAELQRVRAFAEGAHADQRYDDGLFIGHLDAVVKILADFKAPLPVLVAGYLHDVVEDTEVTLAEVEATFGRGVSTMVWAVTVDESDPLMTKAARYTACYKKITEVGPWAALLKTADRTANCLASLKLFEKGYGDPNNPSTRDAIRFLSWYADDQPRLETAVTPMLNDSTRLRSLWDCLDALSVAVKDPSLWYQQRLKRKWAAPNVEGAGTSGPRPGGNGVRV